MSVSYGGDSITFADSSVISSGWTGFKNRVINGTMMVDQRYVGASNTVNAGAYYIDRWLCSQSTDGTLTVQQVADAPTGLYNSMKFTVGTADTSIGASQYSYFRQALEGYNVADFGWGTSAAQTVTLSFWVKSSVTGLFSGNLASSNHDRCSCFTYTINQANTWEYKTVTITGDTTGTWYKNNAIGAYLHFCLTTGSTYQQSVTNTFQAGTYLGYTGTTNLFATSGNTFNITGVQLEKGSTASSFEYRSFGTELALCQRYFYKSYNYYDVPGSVSQEETAIYGYSAGGTHVFGSISFPAEMRTRPSITFYHPSTGTSGQIGYYGDGSTAYTPSGTRRSTKGFTEVYASSNVTTAGRFHITADGEL